MIGSAYCIRALRGRRRASAAAPGSGRSTRRAGRPRRPPARRLRAQPRRPRPPLADRPPRVLRQRRRRATSPRTRPASSPSATRSSPAAATRTSRRGPTSPSSTRSRPACARPPSTTLIDIGEPGRRVRCDMAMLMLNDVFARTWGEPAGPAPASEYWTDVIAAVRGRPSRTSCSSPRPTGTWSGSSSSSGFDHCYDKRLYDRLVARRCRRRSAATCGAELELPASASCASSRTTTSRAPRRARGRTRNGPPR